MFSTICPITSNSAQAGTMIARVCSGRCSRSCWVNGRYSLRCLRIALRHSSRTQYQASMNRSSRLEIRITTATTTAAVSRKA